MIDTKLNNGFTLIEILVSMAILAVLASIAIPAYTGYIKVAKMTEAHNNLAALRLAEEENYLDTNSYFFGNNTAEVESNSNGLWSAAKGSNGNVNFNYVVTTSAVWSATATGNVAGTSIFGEVVPISK